MGHPKRDKFWDMRLRAAIARRTPVICDLTVYRTCNGEHEGQDPQQVGPPSKQGIRQIIAVLNSRRIDG